MKYYLLLITLLGYLTAGTYEQTYTIFDNNSSSKNFDTLMHGDFEEIIRYKEISYEDGYFTDDNNSLEEIAKKILSYDENRIYVSIIGHTYADDKNIEDQLELSKDYANNTANRLEDFNISKEIFIIEHRGGKDNLYTQGTSEGQDLSNQVMVSIYVKTKEKDSDNDGVLDSQDECPTTLEGLDVNATGCHIAEKDSDNDGVLDSQDECPTTLEGLDVNATGCHILEKDSDNDGVLDSQDECPYTISGLEVNEKGCHIFKTLRLNYGSNSAVIKEDSMDEVMKFTTFLNKNAIYKVKIIGHTDNVGSAENNKILSEQRANSVKNYLASNGVALSRITTRGAGEDEPIVSNDTEINKAQNRRIEVEIDFIEEQGIEIE